MKDCFKLRGYRHLGVDIANIMDELDCTEDSLEEDYAPKAFPPPRTGLGGWTGQRAHAAELVPTPSFSAGAHFLVAIRTSSA